MTPNVLRMFGILFLVGAMIVAFLRMPGWVWVAPLLLAIGAVVMVLSRRGQG